MTSTRREGRVVSRFQIRRRREGLGVGCRRAAPGQRQNCSRLEMQEREPLFLAGAEAVFRLRRARAPERGSLLRTEYNAGGDRHCFHCLVDRCCPTASRSKRQGRAPARLRQEGLMWVEAPAAQAEARPQSSNGRCLGETAYGCADLSSGQLREAGERCRGHRRSQCLELRECCRARMPCKQSLR